MKIRSVVIFFVSLLIFGIAYFVIDEIMDIQAETTFDIKGEELGEGNRIEPKVDGQLLFLMVGIDKNIDEIGEARDNHVRTDTMMLVKVDFEEGDINIMSIPRDTQINYNGQKMKINGVHSKASTAKEGIINTMKAVRQVTGLDVDFYMSVDYDAVSRIVDTIGGVEVDSPVEMDVSNDIGVYIPKGKSVLNGKQALYFVRARELLPTKTDYERMENQQYFLRQLMNSVLQISNVTKIGQIADVYKENVNTNIDLGNLTGIAIKGMLNFSSDKMRTETMPTTEGVEYPNGVKTSYLYLDKEKANRLISEMFPEYFINKSDLDKFDEVEMEEDTVNSYN